MLGGGGCGGLGGNSIEGEGLSRGRAGALGVGGAGGAAGGGRRWGCSRLQGVCVSRAQTRAGDRLRHRPPSRVQRDHTVASFGGVSGPGAQWPQRGCRAFCGGTFSMRAGESSVACTRFLKGSRVCKVWEPQICLNMFLCSNHKYV